MGTVVAVLGAGLLARWRDRSLPLVTLACPLAVVATVLVATDPGGGILAGETLVVGGPQAEQVADGLADATAGSGLRVVAHADRGAFDRAVRADGTATGLFVPGVPGPPPEPGSSAPAATVVRRQASPLAAAVAQAAAGVLAVPGGGPDAAGPWAAVAGTGEAGRTEDDVREVTARSVIVLLGLFAAAVEPRAFAADRRTGVWSRWTLASRSRWGPLVARVATSYVLVVGAMAGTWLWSEVLLGVGLGPTGKVAAVLALVALAVAALQWAVASVIRRSDSVDALALAVTLAAALVGGLVVAPFRLPLAVVRVGAWLPTGAAADAFGRLGLVGADAATVAGPVVRLLVGAAVLLAVAARGGPAAWART